MVEAVRQPTSEKANTSDDDTPNVVPTERCFVNLGQSKTPALIGICYMTEIIVEVVECRVSARSPS